MSEFPSIRILRVQRVQRVQPVQKVQRGRSVRRSAARRRHDASATGRARDEGGGTEEPVLETELDARPRVVCASLGAVIFGGIHLSHGDPAGTGGVPRLVGSKV